MTYDYPKYCIEVSATSEMQEPTQFVVRADSPDTALKKARETFPRAHLSAPVRICSHPLSALVYASATSSAMRTTRSYQCTQCGDYISVTSKK